MATTIPGSSVASKANAEKLSSGIAIQSRVRSIPSKKESEQDAPPKAAGTDTVTISTEARILENKRAEKASVETSGKKLDEEEQNRRKEEEKKAVAKLRERDREVRAHEQAHRAALGQYASGGATFKTEAGPDGKQYAVAGEVKFKAKAEEDPEKAAERAQTVRRAALAPADPSAHDRQVAAEAAQAEAGKERGEEEEEPKEDRKVAAAEDTET